MSHYFGIVLVKPCEDVAGEVARLLAPFDEGSAEYEAMFDDEGEETAAYVAGQHWWDWYRIGGRWDGKVRGLTYESAPGCDAEQDGHGNVKECSLDCHYRGRHESLGRNVVSVDEMGEVRPFRLVTPDGETRAREMWISDPDGSSWPWKLADDDGYDRWCGEQLLANRECWAVGIDYHC